MNLFKKIVAITVAVGLFEWGIYLAIPSVGDSVLGAVTLAVLALAAFAIGGFLVIHWLIQSTRDFDAMVQDEGDLQP